MRIKFEKIGVIKDSTVWPQEVSHYITLKKVFYDDESEIQNAIKEIGEWESYDIKNMVFIKSI